MRYIISPVFILFAIFGAINLVWEWLTKDEPLVMAILEAVSNIGLTVACVLWAWLLITNRKKEWIFSDFFNITANWLSTKHKKVLYICCALFIVPQFCAGLYLIFEIVLELLGLRIN